MVYKDMDNKKKILNCAVKLFSLKGYNGVGVQEIVDKAGITKPTLYYYFNNKEGLLKSIFEDNFEIMTERLKKAATYNRDLILTLREIVSFNINFAKENLNFFRMRLSMEFDPPESISYKTIYPYLETQYKIIEEVFLAASNDHGNMKDRQKQYAVTFIGLINTYISLLLSNHITINDEKINKIVHQFMHGIFS